jgi:hypothetical protein
MNIDRHNYEEYFLLYIDNELNVDQKKQVELFVQENPDLEEELVMLKQSRLIPDDSIVFDKKHLLMKEESAPGDRSFINLNNYEQWLIMYVDDELSAEERITVEKFASAHPHVQQEFELFHQTKLKPEEIVFADKEILYRREQPVQVIRVQWWKIAVAAMLIIGTGVTFYSVLHKSVDNGMTPNSVAVNKNEQAPDPKKTDSSIKQEQKTVATRDEDKGREAIEPVAKEKPEIKNSQPGEDRPQFADNLSLPVEKKQIANSTITETRDNTVPDEFKKAIIEEPKKSDLVVLDDETHKGNINKDPVTIDQVETLDNSSKPDDATANNPENKKFRGFFRKATRILERTTSINAAEDDKVLIGGMAINLK